MTETTFISSRGFELGLDLGLDLVAMRGGGAVPLRCIDLVRQVLQHIPISTS